MSSLQQQPTNGKVRWTDVRWRQNCREKQGGFAACRQPRLDTRLRPFDAHLYLSFPPKFFAINRDVLHFVFVAIFAQSKCSSQWLAKEVERTVVAISSSSVQQLQGWRLSGLFFSSSPPASACSCCQPGPTRGDWARANGQIGARRVGGRPGGFGAGLTRQKQHKKRCGKRCGLLKKGDFKGRKSDMAMVVCVVG